MRSFVIIAWIMIGLYLGAAGWYGISEWQDLQKQLQDVARNPKIEGTVYYEGQTFQNAATMLRYRMEHPKLGFLSWILWVPQVFLPLITAAAWGLVGGGAKNLQRLVVEEQSMALRVAFLGPLVCATVGAMIYLLALILPAVFSVGENPIRVTALVPLSFFGGYFSDQASQWVETQVVNKVFGIKGKAKK